MTSLLLCIGLCAVIWIFNGICLIHAVKEKIQSELYMHLGLSIFFSVMVLELTVGNDGAWRRLGLLWLQIAGFVLYLPSAYFVIFSVIDLKHRGKSKGDFTQTTAIIKEGIYGQIRQPMTFGLALWSVAFIMVFQSMITAILCIISFFCFFIAARTESKYNIRKFGDDYKHYMKKVPMWNFLKSSDNSK